MNAHPAAPSRQHPHRHLPVHPHLRPSWVFSVLLGLCYGAYTGFLDYGEVASVGRATVVGVLTAGVITMACLLVGRWRHALIPELRAAVYGALFGSGIGFLHALSGATNYASAVLGLLMGLTMGVASFYLFHTRSGTRPESRTNNRSDGDSRTGSNRSR
jgi:hypothetical protein